MRKMFFRAMTFPILNVQPVFAQTPDSVAPAYPNRPVRVLVGFAPGGGIDAMARFFSHKLTESLGQNFVVENRPGATGNIAAELVSKAPPDGYTLLATSQVHATNASVFSKLPFDPVRDFAPISTLATTPDCIVVHPSLPELIALAKKKPQDLSYASRQRHFDAHRNGKSAWRNCRWGAWEVPKKWRTWSHFSPPSGRAS